MKTTSNKLIGPRAFWNQLFRTGSAFSNQDRGVLGCGNFRMKFRDKSKEFFEMFFVNGLYSSQGTPQRTIRVGLPKEGAFCQGWLKTFLIGSLRLEVRRKRHKTESSSIHLFDSIRLSRLKIDTRVMLLTVFLGAGAGPLCAGELGPDANLKRDPIEAAADGFEGMMLQMLYNQMLQSQRIVNPGDNNPFAPSNGEMIFRSMQEQAMMQQLAKRRPLGFGSLVARQIRGQSGIPQGILLESGRAGSAHSGPLSSKAPR